MFEIPECLTLTRQMNRTLRGRTVARGSLGNSPHKFVWYNRKPAEFARLTRGRRVGTARARGRWMFLGLEPGYVLMLGECGGRVLHHPPGSAPPDRYHLLLAFEDGSALSVMTAMWGAMELRVQGHELEGKYLKDMRPTPVDRAFTLAYFTRLIDSLLEGRKRTVKGLLTQEQLIPGLGNAIAQDIMFRARLDPRRPLTELTPAQQRRLHGAIVRTVREVTRKGGRADEFDLHGKPGGYARIMDARAAGRPCPECGTRVSKIAYLGGACYFCPQCQQ